MPKQKREQSSFERYLRKQNLSENTLTSYLWTIKYYSEHYEDFSKENLLAYKEYLIEFFKPKTVNLRLQGLNKYLVFIKKGKLQLKFVKEYLTTTLYNARLQSRALQKPLQFGHDNSGKLDCRGTRLRGC